MRTLGIVLAGVIGLAGCAHASANTPIDTADQVTKAVYSDDLNGTVAHFNSGLRGQVKTQEVDEMSRMMRGMGSYQKLTTVNADNQNRRYDYQAAFEHGSMLVQMRFDPDGRVAAYRVSPVLQ